MTTGRVMLEVLTKHLEKDHTFCVVSQWLITLSIEEQNAFTKIMENSKKIIIADLYKDLHTETELPFKLTAFRSHMRGYCSCRPI